MAIGLPKDASGAIVPFDTTTMYRENGNQFHVSDFFFEARPRDPEGGSREAEVSASRPTSCISTARTFW